MLLASSHGGVIMFAEFLAKVDHELQSLWEMYPRELNDLGFSVIVSMDPDKSFVSGGAWHVDQLKLDDGRFVGSRRSRFDLSSPEDSERLVAVVGRRLEGVFFQCTEVPTDVVVNLG